MMRTCLRLADDVDFMRRCLIFLFLISSVLPLSAQSRNRGTSAKTSTASAKKSTQPQKKSAAKKVDKKTQLKNEKTAAQKARQMSQAQLAQLNKNVKASLDSVLILDNQIGHQHDEHEPEHGANGIR